MRTVSIDGHDAAHLLRLLAAARDHNRPLVRVLEATSDLRAMPRLRRLVRAVRAAGEERALDVVGDAFLAGADGNGAAMLQALRRAGLPSEGLRQLARWCAARASDRAGLFTAVVYPFTLMLTICVVLLFLFHAFLAPSMVVLIRAVSGAVHGLTGDRVPAPTRLYLTLFEPIAATLREPVPAALYVLFVGLVAFAALRFGLRLQDRRIALFLPVVSRSVRYEAMRAFTDALALLLRHETPLPEALRLAAGAVGNDALRRRMAGLAGRVAAGESLAELLREASYLPRSAAWRLWSAYYGPEFVPELERVSEACAREVAVRAARMRSGATASAWLLAVIFVGPVLGATVLSVYIPLFSLISALT